MVVFWCGWLCAEKQVGVRMMVFVYFVLALVVVDYYFLPDWPLLVRFGIMAIAMLMNLIFVDKLGCLLVSVNNAAVKSCLPVQTDSVVDW